MTPPVRHPGYMWVNDEEDEASARTCYLSWHDETGVSDDNEKPRAIP